MMKAVVLFSGGLDSILAARVLKNLGIDVIALNFVTPFTGRTRGRKGSLPARGAADMLGVEYREVFQGDEYLAMVRDPDFGYGKNVNPCIDCKIFFIKKAGEMMGPLGASFLATGEVLGQRPMSQNRPSLGAIAKRSGLADFLLRPLSAKLLTETLPERRGWVAREKLFDFRGRSRAPQIALAEELGIKDYPNASGGCLLTDREFSRKISDLIKHGELTVRNVELLKFGRHFRPAPEFKLIVGRDEGDNIQLEGMAGQGDYLFRTTGCAGPVGLGQGVLTEECRRLSCRIMARYASTDDSEVEISVSGAEGGFVRARKLEDEKLGGLRIQSG